MNQLLREKNGKIEVESEWGTGVTAISHCLRALLP
jgi:hypothetical protein